MTTLTSAPRARTGTVLGFPTGGIAHSVASAIATGLTELELPERELEALAPRFEAAGCTLETVSLEDPLGGETLRLTLVKKGPERRRVLCFDAENGTSILQVPTPGNRRLVSDVWERLVAQFGRSVTFYLFYRVRPHAAFTLLMEKRWAEVYGLRFELVPLEEADELRAIPGALEQRLIDWLALAGGTAPAADPAAADPGPGPRRLSAAKMLRGELRRLVGVLSEIPSFRTVDDRRALLAEAGLDELARETDLQGAARRVARRLVYDLETPELGQLIEVLANADMDRDDADFVGSLTERYSFDDEPAPADDDG